MQDPVRPEADFDITPAPDPGPDLYPTVRPDGGRVMSPAAHHPAPPTILRLLPWPSPDGKPCYLSTSDSGGYVSRLADDMEAIQLAIGHDVLSLARKVLDDPMSPYTQVRYAGIRLAECLSDVLRVAESRGLRLPGRDTDDDVPEADGTSG